MFMASRYRQWLHANKTPLHRPEQPDIGESKAFCYTSVCFCTPNHHAYAK